jgi:imidazolonepropionase-like amidohydrolase
MYRVVPRALELGVRIATGSDAGASGVAHGSNAQELELLTTAGMSPMEAIVAATNTAAQVLDMADSIGTLEKGKLADLLVVKGNPLENISLLQDRSNILAVMKDGQTVVRRSETQGVIRQSDQKESGR